MSTILFIDGQNFLKRLEETLKEENILHENEKPDWCNYDFSGLFKKVLQDLRVDHKFFYLSKITQHSKTEEKSKELIERQRLLKNHLERQDFKVIKAGRVRGYLQEINNNQKLLFKEKGVDVRIAVDIIIMSLLDRKADNIILASSDSDLQPAIKEIRNRSKVPITYLGFEMILNKGLAYTTI